MTAVIVSPPAHAAVLVAGFPVRSLRLSWRRLDGNNQLPKLILGVRFADGLEVVVKTANRQPTTVAA